MRKYLLLFCLPFLALASCKKEPVNVPVLGKGASLTLLRVNYQTNEFEGGKTFNYSTYYNITDTLPVSTRYGAVDTNTDFLVQVYTPNNDTIFYGGMGKKAAGTIWNPDFEDGNSFVEGGSTAPAPAYSAIKQLTTKDKPLPAFNVAQVWQSVSTLAITGMYMNLADVKVGLFLYKPGPGTSGPETWSWVWVLHKDRAQ